MNKSNNIIPWVEKYRPSCFNDIVLDDSNKHILKNIIEQNYFPNLLFYGPPGTGKTTTIINLINLYQERYNQKRKELVIHLNASDDRGIDIIRNQINQFVNSKGLFTNGIKFIILDEVDYMTKNAQNALKQLLQMYMKEVRFCLICNYISKIDYSLQNEFTRLRFDKLPDDKIIYFIDKVNKNEKLNLNKDVIKNIQQYFKSDIRAMINYMQTNQEAISNNYIISNIHHETLYNKLKDNNKEGLFKYIQNLSRDYNLDKKSIIKLFLNYYTKHYIDEITKDKLLFMKTLLHNNISDTDLFVNYFIHTFSSFF
jgi:DNA polymerase III delta prime subunit